MCSCKHIWIKSTSSYKIKEATSSWGLGLDTDSLLKSDVVPVQLPCVCVPATDAVRNGQAGRCRGHCHTPWGCAPRTETSCRAVRSWDWTAPYFKGPLEMKCHLRQHAQAWRCVPAPQTRHTWMPPMHVLWSRVPSGHVTLCPPLAGTPQQTSGRVLIMPRPGSPVGKIKAPSGIPQFLKINPCTLMFGL